MLILGVSLAPVLDAISLLCCVDPSYANKKHVDGRVGTLPLSVPKNTIIIFHKTKPPRARSIGDWRCKMCSTYQFVIRSENRVCCYCGESSYYEPESTSYPSRPAPYRDFNDFPGKRVTHFKNWVARLQGKERCDISRENLDNIRQRVLMYPDSMSEFQRIRNAMKEIGLQKYYNNVYYVMRYVFGYSLVEFRKINEARLLALFLKIQEPFSRITRNRTNMLSYQFLIKKFCELLGYNVSKFIPHLKSRRNLQQQDLIWRQICDELGLPFYSSV